MEGAPRFGPDLSSLTFDRFELDLRSGELRKEGQKVPLQAKPFQLLALLVEHSGDVVRREEVWRALWHANTFLDFDHGVAVAINKIRGALGDSAVRPRFIETLPKRGYRFIAAVQRSAAPLARRAVNQPSIAVLPFATIGPDEEGQYFGDGLAEDIINALARMRGLMVAGRTSSFFFGRREVDVGEIGRSLNVQHVLEGSVQRSGKLVRVTAQLIDVSTGFHVWSARYDREMTNLFALQDEITTSIAEALRVTLSPEPDRPQRQPPDLAAYDAYLRAREQLLVRPSPGSGARAKQLLERAIQIDRTFGRPHSLLGVYYTGQAFWGGLPGREAIQSARAAEQAALRIDPSLSEAHAMMGCCAGMDFAWTEAERHWSLAMAREPVSHDVLLWYANHFLLPLGRVSEAVEVESNVIDNDPLNLLYRHHLALSLRHAGRLREAEGELMKVLAVDDKYPLALNSLGALFAQQGQFAGALECSEAAYALAPLPQFGGQLAALLRRTGTTSRADSLIEGLQSGATCGASVGLTVYHGLLGQFAQAAEWAERAIEERYTMLIQVIRPLLRSSPQWPALARRMNIYG